MAGKFSELTEPPSGYTTTGNVTRVEEPFAMEATIPEAIGSTHSGDEATRRSSQTTRLS